MSAERGFATHVDDLPESFGPGEAQRSFGHGIFHPGPGFAPSADGELRLETDDRARERFVADGAGAPGCFRQRREYRLCYYRVPESFYGFRDATVARARLAFDATLRAPRKVRGKNQK